MPGIQTKIARHVKKQESAIHMRKINQNQSQTDTDVRISGDVY